MPPVVRTAVLAATLLAVLAGPAAAQKAQKARPRPTIALAPVMIRTAEWERRPSRNDIQSHAPPFARKHGIDGRAVISCRVDAAGYLGACAVETAEPQGAGFDAAALRLAPYFKMAPRLPDGRPVAGGRVRIPIQFGSPPG